MKAKKEITRTTTFITNNDSYVMSTVIITFLVRP